MNRNIKTSRIGHLCKMYFALNKWSYLLTLGLCLLVPIVLSLISYYYDYITYSSSVSLKDYTVDRSLDVSTAYIYILTAITIVQIILCRRFVRGNLFECYGTIPCNKVIKFVFVIVVVMLGSLVAGIIAEVYELIISILIPRAWVYTHWLTYKGSIQYILPILLIVLGAIFVSIFADDRLNKVLRFIVICIVAFSFIIDVFDIQSLDKIEARVVHLLISYCWVVYLVFIGIAYCIWNRHSFKR